MKKKSISILFMVFLLSEVLLSQEGSSPIKHHSYSYGIGANSLKDENLFPIVHKGAINEFNYRFEKRGRNYHEISALFRYSKIKADLETDKVSQNAQIGIGYSMGYHVIKGESTNFYMGYNLGYLISFVEFPVWDESRAYWGTSLALGLSNSLFINLSKDQCLVTSLNITPLGLYSRPDEVRLYAQENYTLNTILKTMNSNFRPGFAGNVFLSNFRTEYRFPAKKGRYFAFIYSLSYSRIQKSKEHPLLNSINSFGISLGL